MARADWIAVTASFLVTFVAAWLAAVVALRTQRADFRVRAEELAQQTAEAQVQRAADWRLHTVARAFGVLDGAAQLGLSPYSVRDGEALTLHAAESMRMQFRLDPRGGGKVVGDWFVNQIGSVLTPNPQPPLRDQHVRGLTAQVRHELTEWAAGETSNTDFHSK